MGYTEQFNHSVPTSKYGPPNERIRTYNRWYADFLDSNQSNNLFSKAFEDAWILQQDLYEPRADSFSWQGLFRDDFVMFVAGGEPYAHFPRLDWIPLCPIGQ